MEKYKEVDEMPKTKSPPLYTREEIKEGCENCSFCAKDCWERGIPWCKYKQCRDSIPVRGTYNCVFWNKQ